MQVTMVLARSALFHYYNKIPNSGSSSSSSGLTPAGLHSGFALSTTSESIAACSGSVGNASYSQSAGMSVCDNSRKRKGTSFKGNRRRSNPAVPLALCSLLRPRYVLCLRLCLLIQLWRSLLCPPIDLLLCMV